MTATEILREEVKQYVEHADDKSHRMALAILKIESGEDWEDEIDEVDEDWDDLPQDFKLILEEALKEAEEGKEISHAEVVEKYSKWFRK